MRSWGPTKSRFDHHAPPPHARRRAIAYLAYGGTPLTTAIAAYFQDESGAGVGPLDVVLNGPTATVFETVTDLVLLDLASEWMTRAGGLADRPPWSAAERRGLWWPGCPSKSASRS